MTDDAMVSPQEIRSIAKRVLAIERAILRRAWGIMFGIAALELFVRLLLPVASYTLGFSTLVYGFWTNLAVQTIVPLFALFVAVRIFRRVYALRFVRKSITGSFWIRMIRPIPALVVFSLAYAGIIAALVFLPNNFVTILFGLAVAQIPPFYYFMKVCFPEGLPREGIASLLGYSFAAIGTFLITLSSLVSNPYPYLFFWGTSTAVFLLAFVQTRFVKLPEPSDEDVS
jgi:hypothetical protein